MASGHMDFTWSLYPLLSPLAPCYPIAVLLYFESIFQLHDHISSAWVLLIFFGIKLLELGVRSYSPRDFDSRILASFYDDRFAFVPRPDGFLHFGTIPLASASCQWKEIRHDCNKANLECDSGMSRTILHYASRGNCYGLIHR